MSLDFILFFSPVKKTRYGIKYLYIYTKGYIYIYPHTHVFSNGALIFNFRKKMY